MSKCNDSECCSGYDESVITNTYKVPNTYSYEHPGDRHPVLDDAPQEMPKLDQALAKLNDKIDGLGKAVAVAEERLSSVTNHHPCEIELKGGKDAGICVSVNSSMLDEIFDATNRVQQHTTALYVLLEKLDV